MGQELSPGCRLEHIRRVLLQAGVRARPFSWSTRGSKARPIQPSWTEPSSSAINLDDARRHGPVRSLGASHPVTSDRRLAGGRFRAKLGSVTAHSATILLQESGHRQREQRPVRRPCGDELSSTGWTLHASGPHLILTRRRNPARR